MSTMSSILYIKVHGGEPVDHPVYKDNLIQVYGVVPEGYEPFTRKESKIHKVDYTYIKINGVWTDA